MSREQIEEMMLRFKQLVPQTDIDSRFLLGIASVDGSQKPIPFVYLSSDKSKGSEMPSRYILVLKTGEDEFQLKFQGFYILVGVGIPTRHWPEAVTSAELDEIIIQVWETLFNMEATIAAYTKRLMGPGPEDTLPL